MFYLTTHSTHFIYGYRASDIWLRTILIVRKETRCRHISYSCQLTARVLLYAPSHRQDSTYHGLCYTSRGALPGTKNSSMGPPHEGSIRWPGICINSLLWMCKLHLYSQMSHYYHLLVTGWNRKYPTWSDWYKCILKLIMNQYQWFEIRSIFLIKNNKLWPNIIFVRKIWV